MIFLDLKNKKEFFDILTQEFPIIRLSFCLFVTLRLPPLDSETGWTGEVWSNNNFFKGQN